MTAPAPRKSFRKKSRTFTRVEMQDAARLAELHGLAVRFEPDGALVMFPPGHGAAGRLDNEAEDSAESALDKWKAKRGKTAGRAHH